MLGRDGVGRGTVAAALTASGVAVTSDPATADVHVVVIAEALKPEDRLGSWPPTGRPWWC